MRRNLTSTKECFLDPISATGVAGLPGPGRIMNAAGASSFCASNNVVQYTPGVGGCPP